MALSVAGGLGLFAGASTGAAAESGSGAGGNGDGSLHLIPEIIANERLSTAGSAEFAITARLFLPPVESQARRVEQSRAAVTNAVDTITFEGAENASAADDFARMRSRLFQDYSHQAIPGTANDDVMQGTDLWFVVLIAASVPLGGLAAFLGLKMASRRASGHA
ncbi:hypothetical protein [Leifsonia sp. C5G2]|uniref:hypothetical protein n=1 Tax=Leifsonia sp. C5G2 TaxID=2735269 RepID=UPI0015850491|nr:hypothetical protein [Leifsonia sp. C5G2]NUU08117.1 hypothetical protein [Leifsonia sp. C5G2]